MMNYFEKLFWNDEWFNNHFSAFGYYHQFNTTYQTRMPSAKTIFSVFLMFGTTIVYFVTNSDRMQPDMSSYDAPSLMDAHNFSLFTNDDDNATIYVMHIPKTGGSSFKKTWKKYKRNIPRFRSWDSSFKDDGSEIYVSTLGREPYAHLVSMWKHCVESPYWADRSKYFQWVPFDSWINYWSYFRQHFNGSLEKEHYENYTRSSIPVSYEPFKCYTGVAPV